MRDTPCQSAADRFFYDTAVLDRQVLGILHAVDHAACADADKAPADDGRLRIEQLERVALDGLRLQCALAAAELDHMGVLYHAERRAADVARLIQAAAGQGDLSGIEQAVDPEHAGGMEALGLHSRGAQ